MADKTGMTYTGSGVDYDALDPFKRAAQVAAATTAGNLRKGFGIPIEASRGESAYLFDMGSYFLAHVEEGLGTKNLVADAMHILTGEHYYGSVAQCTIAMMVNDVITVGALPMSIAMHVASGSSDWFKDVDRANDLIKGWLHGCNLSRAVWAGGETPTLRGVVVSDTVVLSGSVIGKTIKRKLITSTAIQHGDAIVICESSGIHANGLTLGREIAEKLPDGYMTVVPDTNGLTYGEVLLTPTNNYVELVSDCMARGVDIHYAVNITGHGWRKFMRAPSQFRYVIDALPIQQPIFDFMREHGPVDIEEAYGNLNMGAGFALFIPQKHVEWFLSVLALRPRNFKAYVAGHIEVGPRSVVIDPLSIEFKANTLELRG